MKHRMPNFERRTLNWENVGRLWNIGRSNFSVGCSMFRIAQETIIRRSTLGFGCSMFQFNAGLPAFAIGLKFIP
jgi:hypothetical protein